MKVRVDIIRTDTSLSGLLISIKLPTVVIVVKLTVKYYHCDL